MTSSAAVRAQAHNIVSRWYPEISPKLYRDKLVDEIAAALDAAAQAAREERDATTIDAAHTLGWYSPIEVKAMMEQAAQAAREECAAFLETVEWRELPPDAYPVSRTRFKLALTDFVLRVAAALRASGRETP